MSTAPRGARLERTNRRTAPAGEPPAALRRAHVALAAPRTRSGRRDPGGLTRREVEILQLVAHGMTNGAVARTLWVSSETVKFHLSNVYRKLGVGNRAEATRWAIEVGLADGATGNPPPRIQTILRYILLP